uniref:Pentatricopeptide repeat-containing protein n=1 Tax=Nelumbo nucifera TaxID=4432 RepID=A0A822Z3U9_NELNU|nr:TPA_asm: hypothetical protein HUJ06_013800 [Nelumbo nucifera]
MEQWRAEVVALWEKGKSLFIVSHLEMENRVVAARNLSPLKKSLSSRQQLMDLGLWVSAGKAFHAESITIGVDSDVGIGTSLVSMYSKCRDIVGSHRVFDEMPDRNLVTCNAMIRGCSRNGDMGSASFSFERMLEKTEVTWAEMIDGYARNGVIIAARRLFNCSPHEMRNLVTWTVMIDGYVRIGQLKTARQLFEEMPQRNCYSW